MNETRVLLDTMAWWEIVWGTPTGRKLDRKYLQPASTRVHASALALAEMAAKLDAAGHGERIEDALLAIRASARIEPVTDAIAEAGGRLRRALRARAEDASLADALQLATARAIGARLVSSDPAFRDERDVEAFR